MARLSRKVLRFLAPELDSSPVEGGLGPHPLGLGGRAPWWSALPEDDALGAVALLAESDPEAATARLLAWLDNDISGSATPGEGAAWSLPDVVAVRLIHLAAFHAWVNTDTVLSQRIAGQARAHAAWLFAELPIDTAHPDTALCHAALLIAGCAWPALEDARRWRGPALAGLPASLSEAVGDDGASGYTPALLARALWAAALARGWVEAAGGSFPQAAEDALMCGALALWRIGGDTGQLPTADVTALLPLGPTSLSHTLRNLCLVWGLDDGEPAIADDPACLLLAGRLPEGTPESMCGVEWQLWTWRSVGAAAAHRIIRKKPSRVWYSAATRQVDWTHDGEPVVSGALPEGFLKVGRVDGSQATLIHLPSEGIVDMRLRQARLSITQSGADEVTWEISEDWALTADEQGGYTGKRGKTQLIVKLDPSWQWSLSGGRLVGRGDPERVKYSFELR
ncbi:MAG: hypothetical protein ACI8RZ_006282 [Myxococcota bacterium]|jgi:hypothetical protein